MGRKAVISGRIDGDGWPIVPLRIVLPDGGQYRIEFLVDTGYDGQLTLLPDLVQLLALVPTGETREAIVASGAVVGWPVYRASVLWNGQVRNVEVLESDTPPLLGMAMLYDPDAGHADRLTIDAAQLTVLIEHNTPPSFTED